MIPKIIHYIWVGGRPLPKRLARNVLSWQRYNPDFDIVLWDERTIDWSSPFVRLAYEQKSWAKLADYIRLTAVRDQGGIYLDTDVEAVQPFEPLLSCACFFGFQPAGPDDPPVNNAVFGAIRQHWLLAEACAFFEQPVHGEVRAMGTGPELVSALLQRHGLAHEVDAPVRIADVDVLPYWVFYPFHWQEDFHPTCVRSETIAIHHWELSWHLHDATWLRRHVLGLLKANPSLHRRVRSVFRRLRRPNQALARPRAP